MVLNNVFMLHLWLPENCNTYRIKFGKYWPRGGKYLTIVFASRELGHRWVAWLVGVPSKISKYTRTHDDVIKWKPFPRYWPFVRGIHRSPVNSPRKGQWRGALMFTLICARINGWVNNREAGDLRRYRAHYDVIVMVLGGYTWSIMRTQNIECCHPFSESTQTTRTLPETQGPFGARARTMRDDVTLKRRLPLAGCMHKMISENKTSWLGNALRITGPLWRESTDRNNTRLWCFLLCQPEEAIKQAVELPVIWDAMTLVWCQCNDERGMQ